MNENEEKRSSLWREIAGQMSDHVDLAALELRFEAAQVKKRAQVLGVVFILALTGFIILQVAAVTGLARLGFSLAASSGILGGGYFAAAALIYAILGRRDKRAGPPFAASQRELKESLRWIQKLFS